MKTITQILEVKLTPLQRAQLNPDSLTVAFESFKKLKKENNLKGLLTHINKYFKKIDTDGWVLMDAIAFMTKSAWGVTTWMAVKEEFNIDDKY